MTTDIVRQGRLGIAVNTDQAVDNIRVQTYWQVGERIVREELKRKDRADYGKQIVKRLAVDIGILERNIYFMYQFYKAYPILNAVRSELSWTHYRILISLQSQKEREFYEIQTIKNSWSTRELEHRVKTNEYAKAKREGKLEVSLPPQLPSPEEIFKDTYDWTFLDLEKDHTERELEEGLMQHIEKVLLELGKGFAFMGRQQKVLINNTWHRIDILFYNVLLKCYVIVDIKARPLQRGDIEQVVGYLTYYRMNKIEGDRDPIGLIICQDKDTIDVRYAAGKNIEDIFVAEYLPKLPSEQELKRKLEEK
ncbi:MAG: PDDEXK nuclease domain-containing protein, partial [bacterium]|nr:PDDEXK nuclease domain-containing protein [bacterium]